MRLIFAGTPDFAATNLQSLLDFCSTNEHEIVAVYTQPDRQSGRGKKIQFSPVKQLAVEHEIPVEQPINFKNLSDREQLSKYNADLMIVVAYGLLLPQSVLDTPKKGCINVHGSLLPRWRGAAPIQRAIEAGDSETGITIMQMEAGLDTGPMLLKATTPIDENETGASLHDKLAQQGALLLPQAIDIIINNEVVAEIQNEQLATYAHKLSKHSAQIDWRLPAIEIERKIRAFNSWPISFSYIKPNLVPSNSVSSNSVSSSPDSPNQEPSPEVVRIWQSEVVDMITDEVPGTILSADKSGILVACGKQLLRILQLQMAGTKAMNVQEWLNAPQRLALFAQNQRFVFIHPSAK